MFHGRFLNIEHLLSAWEYLNLHKLTEDPTEPKLTRCCIMSQLGHQCPSYATSMLPQLEFHLPTLLYWATDMEAIGFHKRMLLMCYITLITLTLYQLIFWDI